MYVKIASSKQLDDSRYAHGTWLRGGLVGGSQVESITNDGISIEA